MSTTSPNFGLIIATTADQVNVVTHVAGNFSTLDSLLGIVHTGTGQLKSGIVLVNPAITGGSLTGTLAGGVIAASTGIFSTITATAGALTLNTLNIGNYNVASAVGNSGDVLTVVTGNARFVAPAPGTGANKALSNLDTVAINTNIGTFTAGLVTVDKLVTTSGVLTGLTSFQATTGTFAGNLLVSATVNANAVNCTGGAITAAGFAIGTYGYPATAGSTGQILTMTTGNARWIVPNLAQTAAYFNAHYTGGNIPLSTSGGTPIPFDTKRFDSASQYDTAAGTYTVTASGYYQFGCVLFKTTGSGVVLAYLTGPAKYSLGVITTGGSLPASIAGSVLVLATSGNVFTIIATAINGTASVGTYIADGVSYNSLFWGMKVPDV